VFLVRNICDPVTDHYLSSREVDGSWGRITVVCWMSEELNSGSLPSHWLKGSTVPLESL